MTAAIQKRADMILLPGWACTAQVWAGVIPRLGEFAVPQSLDLPAAKAGKSKADLSLEHMAQQLLAAAPQRAVWVGWSLGGLIAAQAAFMAPHRVTALVLVACTPKFVRGHDWRCAMPAGMLAEFQRSLDGDAGGTLRRFAALCAHNGRRVDAAIARTLAHAMQSASESDCRMLAAELALLMCADLRDVFRALTCPVLCILGEWDPLVPIAVADALPALNPRFKILRIAGAGHAAFISHPVEFINALRDFCGGL
ncbi:MAG TPA: alpha/beta fold hydrolase [Gammaproteobacteria bacterium]|nr:alpha/beta fold hydrolase [Gammaproteobacteria bacterium]